MITIYSDEASRQQRDIHYEKITKINDNTCYKYILNIHNSNNRFYYVNNNIPADKNYESSFFKTYPFISPPTSDGERISRWPLFYKSELIVPICPVHITADPFNKNTEVAGFLCIDCDEIDGFHPRYDVGLLQGVADGIYDLILLSSADHKIQTTTQFES